jgi:flagellar hook-basal body complex protein FliE
MSVSVTAVGNVAGLPSPEALRGGKGKPGEFLSVLETAVGQVEKSREAAADAMGRMLAGEGEEIHSTVLAAQRAELSFELFLQVRNKVVQAYQEVMRMQM